MPTVRIDYLMETKQVIGGKVTKLFGGVAKDCPVVLFAPKLKLTSVTNTDEKVVLPSKISIIVIWLLLWHKLKVKPDEQPLL